MGILSGALSVRRFRVSGEVPEDFRDRFRDALQKHAFREPTVSQGKEEIRGWVCTQNLLDTDFTDFNRWLYGEYAMFALRVDKKSLPAKLFKATVAKRAQAWCQERGTETCPAYVKTEIHDELEREWLVRALPRVTVTEAVWHLTEGWLALHSQSVPVGDEFRKLFHRTFGVELLQWSPLDWTSEEPELFERLLATAPTMAGGPDGG